jgi:predicted MFS family arabinose efflux permease
VRPSWRGANALFFACSIVQFVADGHTNAFTPLFLRELGLSPPEVAVWTGLLVVVTTGMAFPLTPFWGVLAERFSRRKIVLRSYYVYTIALLLTAWAPDIAVLIPARALMGLGGGTIGVIVATQALLVPRRQLGQSIAMVQAAMPIAASLGPPLGAMVIPWIGLRWLFALDAFATLVAALALTLLMPEPAGPVSSSSVLGRTGEVLKVAWTLKPVRWNFICAAALRGATAVVDSYLPVRITQVAADPTSAIGWILGIYGALTSVATWAVGRILHRVEEATIYTRAVFAATLLTAGMAIAPSLWLLGLLAVARSVPVAFGNTVLHSHNAGVVPRLYQTAVLGMSPMPRNFGGLVFPLFAAAVAGLAPGAALAVGALGYATSSLAGIKLRRATRAYLAGTAMSEVSEREEGESGVARRV